MNSEIFTKQKTIHISSIMPVFILSFLIILFTNIYISEIYAQTKYKEYNIKPFSCVPHPITHSIMNENIIHKNDILLHQTAGIKILQFGQCLIDGFYRQTTVNTNQTVT